MKKILSFFTAIFIFTTAGCDKEVERTIQSKTNSKTKGSIEIDLSTINKNESAYGALKSIVSDTNMKIETVDISGIGPNDAIIDVKNIYVASGKITIDNLAAGSWAISITGKNVNGDAVIQGSNTAEVFSGKVSPVNIILKSIDGNGTLMVSVSWPDGLITNPSLTALLTPIDNNETSISFEMAKDNLSGSYSNSELNSGWYRLYISLNDDEFQNWSTIKAVKIIKGQVTSASFSLNNNDIRIKPPGGIVITIGTEVQRPISITFDGNREKLLQGEDMTITAITSEDVDSYEWYLYGELLTGESSSSITIGSLLDLGKYELNLIVVKGNIISSEEVVFQVVDSIPATRISLNKNHTTIETGASEKLIATVEPSNATNQNLTWSSDNERIATVSKDGTVTAVGEGVTYITATTEDSMNVKGGVYGFCQVVVKDGFITWGLSFGGIYYDGANSIRQTIDGGFIVAGETSFTERGDIDMYIVKLDKFGDETGEITYGGASFDGANSIQQTSDKGYIIAGITESAGAGAGDLYIVKLDTYGNEIWTNMFGGINYDGAYSIQQTNDDGYIIAGETKSIGAGSSDMYILKLDKDGNFIWDKTFGGTENDGAYSIEQTSDGGYIVAGVTESIGAGSSDMYILKLDKDGNSIWDKTFGGAENDAAYSIQQTLDEGYIVAGVTSSFGAGSGDLYILKLDADGNDIWIKTFGETNFDGAKSIQQTRDGGYIVAGSTESVGAGSSDMYILKLNADGDGIWDKTFGGTEYESANSIQQTIDGGYIVAGKSFSYNSFGDMYILKLDQNGNIKK